ncbi:shikimate dehydrogenase [Caloramator sp. E03]|uniref:shikimate dehydrogenase n=1 Tax=Caloramator sp. E03 TaxID=2576307 RepID=UPI0011103AFA|nr:shikimate dehydrogenase [Caloramator sp. E03]QCX34131.1 shikimate dehydrogenase [Caloramator sp. E03]
MAERITGKTKLIGLIATPISHSLSPTMHNEAFAKLGLDYVYLAFDCGNEQLEDVVKGFRALNIRGFNVSMPNKTVIHKYLDKLSPAAELAGAVNTVVNDNGVLTGHITDGTGYMQSIKEEGVDVIGKKMTIIGAGGAATAISIQAALDGVKEISIFNRKDEFYKRAEKTVKDINEKTQCKAQLFDLDDTDRLRAEIAESVILTDATSVGMKPLENFCNIPDPSMLRPDLVVSDVVYIPKKTKLLEMAEKQGCKIINGLGMMLWQGAKAFELWTGHEMPVDYIKEILFK